MGETEYIFVPVVSHHPTVIQVKITQTKARKKGKITNVCERGFQSFQENQLYKYFVRRR